MERKYRQGTVSQCIADAGAAERRSSAREPHFLIAALLWGNDLGISVACTVRDMSETGARLEIDYTGIKRTKIWVQLPAQFTLHLCASQRDLECELVWQDGRHFGVKFLGGLAPPDTQSS